MNKLRLALVNNMPDAALKSTERQFRELLSRASIGFDLHLRLFSLPGRTRSDDALAYMREQYEEIDDLWSGDAFDGLIVTGTEPRSAALEDEPFWPALTRIFTWAEDHTASAILSCHAAHAAVLYFDGIARQRLPRKLFGVYECAKGADHPIMAGEPLAWVTPHSRYNDLPEAALAKRGYTILSRSDEAGANIFALERKSLFLFVQGHPEYDRGALLREYRRDVARFLAGERADYPAMPVAYFTTAAALGFAAFADRARQKPDPALLAEFPFAAVEAGVTDTWRPSALRLYGNWLAYLAARRPSAERTAPRVAAQQRQ
jgi:homoserine O-succinyltransferase